MKGPRKREASQPATSNIKLGPLPNSTKNGFDGGRLHGPFIVLQHFSGQRQMCWKV